MSAPLSLLLLRGDRNGVGDPRAVAPPAAAARRDGDAHRPEGLVGLRRVQARACPREGLRRVQAKACPRDFLKV